MLGDKLPGRKFLGAGTNRETYLSRSGKYVFKVQSPDVLSPYNGLTHNMREAADYNNKDKDNFLIKMARCRLFRDILIMEYVEPVTKWQGLPPWVSYVDCGQVGYNCKGELVAYDWV